MTKALLQAQALVVVLSLTAFSRAGQTTIAFDDVPANVHCDETWTNQNVILRFTETIEAEDGAGGFCAFGIEPGYVDLYPSRLRLDFELLHHPITRIEADVGGYHPKLFAYSGGTNIGETETGQSMLYLDFVGARPDSCALRSFEGWVSEVRIYTEENPKLNIAYTNGLLAISWAADAGAYVLEKTDYLTTLPAWTSETNNVQLEGSNFVYRVTSPSGSSFFRVRH